MEVRAKKKDFFEIDKDDHQSALGKRNTAIRLIFVRKIRAMRAETMMSVTRQI